MMSSGHQKRVAAVDIGSNSIHLTVAEVTPASISVLHKEKVNARLGSLLDAHSQLPLEAIEDAVQSLIRFRGLCAEFKAEMRVGATAAVRKAKNRALFIASAAAQGIGCLIGDIHEARLVRAGALFGLPSFFGRRALCVDVGGGSTEVSLGQAGSLMAVTSLPVGGLTIQSRWAMIQCLRLCSRVKKSVCLNTFTDRLRFFGILIMTALSRQEGPFKESLDFGMPTKIVVTASTVKAFNPWPFTIFFECWRLAALTKSVSNYQEWTHSGPMSCWVER